MNKIQAVGPLNFCPDVGGGISHYSDGSLSEPSSLDEPAAILSADLLLDLLHFICGCRCIISTVEKIGVAIATVPVIMHDFWPLLFCLFYSFFLPFKFNFITLIPFKKSTNDLIRRMSSNGANCY